MTNFYYFSLFALFFVPFSSNAQGFTDVSLDAGIDFLVDHQQYMGGGAAFFDYDRDGNLDLYVTGGEDRDRLYRNLGDGSFEDKTMAAGLAGTADLFTHGVATGDIDNDGYRDIFIGTWTHNNTEEYASNLLFRNNGDGTFSDVSTTAGIQDSAWATSATFGDFNLDGLLDIYVANYVEDTEYVPDSTGEVIGFGNVCFLDNLYINNGDGSFTDRAEYFGLTEKGCGLAAVATDFDEDANIDLMVINDFGHWVLPNRLYRNPDFENVSEASGADLAFYGMGVAIGDYDEDDDLDYYVTNLGRNALLQNQGDGTFNEVATEADVENTDVIENNDTLFVTGWGTAFFDYDNDSHLDLYVCNGYMAAAAIIETTFHDPNKLYRNNLDGTFTDVAADMGVADPHAGRGFALGDYDNDGDLDMVVVNINVFVSPNPKVTLYRNDSDASKHWVELELEGVASNRDAFGAHVRLYAGGRSFLREVGGGSSHSSQHSSILHFGLADMTVVDSVVITWPGGRKQKECNIALDAKMHIVEDLSATAPTCTSPSSSGALSATVLGLHNRPNPFSGQTVIGYDLAEGARVRLSLYSALGESLGILEEGWRSAGEHALVLGRDLAAGVYFYSLEVDGQVFSRRLVVLE